MRAWTAWIEDQVRKFGVVVGFAALLLAGVFSAGAVAQQATTTNCAVNTSDPSYTNGTIRLCSMTTAGRLRVDASGSSGNVNSDIVATGGNTLADDDDAAGTTTPVPVGGIYNTTLPTYTNLDRTQVQSDVNGRVLVQSTGNVASGATDSGNPVKVGGRYNSTLPTLTDGQRGDLQLTARGGVNIAITDGGTNTASLQNATADGQSAGNVGVWVNGGNRGFNGSTWDRQFTCPSSAAISVTAGSTTEIVALTASQVIRVCSFVLTTNLAGTAQFVYGTGTNCDTGAADLTGDMHLATNGALTLSGMNGSLFRTAASNALCVTAVTGNAVGFVTYAKY